MSSFEGPARPAAESKEAPEGLKEYFESYIADAKGSEDTAAFVDLATMKSILGDINNGDYSSARTYLDSEIVRMRTLHEGDARMDAEEGKPYVDKITGLRASLN